MQGQLGEGFRLSISLDPRLDNSLCLLAEDLMIRDNFYRVTLHPTELAKMIDDTAAVNQFIVQVKQKHLHINTSRNR